MIRIAIIDDEAHIRETLGLMLQRHCPETELAGTASSVAEGIDLIRDVQPDLVFLDINMADGTGFDLLNALSPVRFHVIFISAMDRNTIRAFRLSGMEYLLKPVDPDLLQDTVMRSMKMQQEYFTLQLQALEENVG